MRARHRHFNPVNAGATLSLDARFINQADNTSVSSWSSRVGGSFTMSQATAANQPTFQLAEVNGQPIVRFDGVNDFLSCSRIATTSNFTTVVVVKGVGQNNKLVFSQRSAGASVGRTVFCGTGDVTPFQKGRLFFNNVTSYTLSSTTDVFDNNITLFCSESDGSGNSHVRVKNGQKEGTLTGQTWTPENANALLGGLSATLNQFAGDVGIAIFVPAQCSDSIRTRIHHASAFSFKIECN